jgi:hypothetical protein
VDSGLNKRFSLSICRYYEIIIYSWLAWFTIVAVRTCKLSRGKIVMKMVLLLLCAVTLILGVVGIAKAIPIELTDVRYPTTSESATMLLFGFGLIGLAGFGRELSSKPSPSKANQMKAIPKDNGGRRFRFERREFSYTIYSPERRSDKDRRSGTDRRKIKRTLPVLS